MDVEAALETFKQHMDSLQTERQALLAPLRAHLEGLSKEIFERHPSLESFSWTQYTPYFNDGSPCVFDANVEYLRVVYDGVEQEELSEWTFSDGAKHYPDLNANAGLKECYALIRRFLSTIPEEMFKDLFGDHARVTVTATGIDVEEYDHD